MFPVTATKEKKRCSTLDCNTVALLISYIDLLQIYYKF